MLSLAFSPQSIESVIEAEVASVNADADIAGAIAQRQRDSAGDRLWILDADRLLGYVSDRALLDYLASGGDPEQPVRHLTCRDIPPLNAEQLPSSDRLLALLATHDRLPVLDAERRFIGVITPRSLLAALSPASPPEENASTPQDKETEARPELRTLRESPLAACAIAPQNDRCLDVNASFSQLLDYAREDLIGVNLLDLGIWSNREIYEQLKTRWQRGEFASEIETTVRTRTGSVRSVSVSLLGDRDRLVIVAADNTNEAQLRAAVETIPGFVSWFSSDNRYIGVNEYLARTLDVSSECFIGQEVGFLGNSSAFASFVSNFLASDRSSANQVISSQASNSQSARHYLVAAQKYCGGSAAVTIGIDVTERVRIEQSLQRLNEKLETKVTERTLELQQALLSLEVELAERRYATRELIESEGRFRGIFEQAAVGIAQLDKSGRFVHVNLRCCEIFGCDRDQLMTCPCLSLFSDIEAQALERVVEQLLAGEMSSYSCEASVRRPDRRRVWIELTLSVARDLSGEPLSLLVVVQDISDRVAAETALRESEERYRLLAENATDLIAKQAPDSTYLYVSPACRTLLGYEPEDLVGRSPYEFFHPEDLATLNASHQNLLDAQENYTTVYRCRRRDRSYIWFESTSRAVRAPETGRVVSIVTVARDVTARQQVESQLRVRDRAIASSNNGILIADAKDPHLPLVYVNPAFERMTGYTAAELLGRSCPTLQWERSDLLGIQRLQEAIAQGSSCTVVLRHPRQNGTFFWSETSFAPVYDHRDSLSHYIGVYTDITERKQLEEELRAALVKEKELSELKSHFVTMTSHEFRTPLTTILSSSELLEHYRHRWDDSKQLTHLKRIQSAALRLTEMLNDILIIGKAEAGRLEYNPSPIDIVQFCQQTAADLQQSHRDRVKIDFRAHGDRCLVPLDSRLLHHVLSNLLANAVKYSPSGESVDFELASEGDRLRFQIRDRGIGIPEADLAHIFESFYRAGNVENIEGTGLGLCIVKHCTELHGGTIEVRSQPGEGTTFTVTLPLASHSHGDRAAPLPARADSR